MRRRHTLDRGYFSGLYRDDPDPWSFASSPYEAAKYAATLAALPRHRYARALEVGCSIGVLTRQLAPRCSRLVAMDIAAEPLATARTRCADLGHVTFVEGAVPDDWPAGRFDLIVLSEVVYYLSVDDVGRLCSRIEGALAPGGEVLLVHWLGTTDYPLSGDEAAERVIHETAGTLRVAGGQRTADYRLDHLTRE